MCEICHGKGLIPFKNKQGKSVPFCWQACECKQPEPEHYVPLKSEDFDFPMSWTFRRFVEANYGKGDPGPDCALAFERERQVYGSVDHSVPDPARTPAPHEFDQMKGNLISLRDSLKQHVNETRPKRPRGEY